MVSLSPNPVNVGQTVTVKAVAKDAGGATLRAFSGAASWSDKSGALAPGAPADFAKGVSTTSAQLATPYRGEEISITGDDQIGVRRSCEGQHRVVRGIPTDRCWQRPRASNRRPLEAPRLALPPPVSLMPMPERLCEVSGPRIWPS